MEQIVHQLLKTFPKTYSEQLGIDLKSKKPSEIFKWFLAAILFGKPIQESCVIKTFNEFRKRKLLTPEKICEAGWHKLVEALDAGSYTRYDFSTADKLLEIMKNLGKAKYLVKIYENSSNENDLRNRLKNLGKGIGDVTIDIFFREMRDIWHVNPLPSVFTVTAAKNLGLIKSKNPAKALIELKKIWREVGKGTFVNLETALLKLGKNFCRKKKCKICGFQGICTLKKKGHTLKKKAL